MLFLLLLSIILFIIIKDRVTTKIIEVLIIAKVYIAVVDILVIRLLNSR